MVDPIYAEAPCFLPPRLPLVTCFGHVASSPLPMIPSWQTPGESLLTRNANPIVDVGAYTLERKSLLPRVP